jgi:hypothetical protein
MRITFDHEGFQRGTMAVVALGGAGALAATVAGADAGLTAAISLASAALPLMEGALRAPRAQRWPSAIGALLAVVAAALVWRRLAGALASEEEPSSFALIALGLVSGPVAALGLVGRFLRLARDPVGEAIDGARPELDRAGLSLCARAATAAAKIRVAATTAAGGAESRRATADAEAIARRVALEIVALLRRQRAIARQAEAPSAGELAAHIGEVEAQLAAATDPLAREAYARARAALHDQGRRLETLRVSADRVLARLHTEVAALEATALAIAARGGAATAEDAAALAPLADRLRTASGDLDLEAEAVIELAAMQH